MVKKTLFNHAHNWICIYIIYIYIYFAYTYVYIYIYTYAMYTHYIYNIDIYIYIYIYICIYITISSRSDMERLSLKAHSFNVHGSQKLASQGHSDARGPMRAKVQNLRGKNIKSCILTFIPLLSSCHAAIPWISCTTSCQPNAVATLEVYSSQRGISATRSLSKSQNQTQGLSKSYNVRPPSYKLVYKPQ